MKKDKFGRVYATLEATKEGDKIQVDDAFPCMDHDEVKEVKKDDEGLYVECTSGKHYLDGQLEGGSYVGMYKME